MQRLLLLGRVTPKKSSIGESQVPVPVNIKFPVVPDCGHCAIRMGRLQRGTKSDDAGITVFMMGDPKT